MKREASATAKIISPRKYNRNSAPLKIAGLYAIIVVLWIMYSDQILAANVSDSIMLSQLQTFKGWFFILTTAVLLFFLVRHYLADIQQEGRSLAESEQYNRALFEQSPVGLALCRMDGKLIDVNPAYAGIIGRTVEETLALNYWDITPKKYVEQEQAQLDSLQEAGRYGPYEKEYIHKDGHLVPVRLQGLLIDRNGEQCIWSSVEDITERKRTELILASEKQVMEVIAQDGSLPEVLEKIVLNIESLSQDTIASILLLAADGLHVHYGAAPNLPEAYNLALEGAAIGPKAGSCGTAAYLRKTVIVTDIETDPLWSDYRALARTYGLRACWATPIMSYEGKVLGTFAMYYREPRSPIAEDFELIVRATHIAGIAIERKRAVEALQASKEFAENLIQTSNVIFVQLDGAGNVLRMNKIAESVTGYSQSEVIGRNWFELLVPRDHYPYVWEEFERITQSGEMKDIFENPILTKTGEECQILWKNKQLREGDKIAGTISFGMDITERKRAEQNIRVQLDELLRWQVAMLGREGRLSELKTEVNQLLAAQGKPARYANPEA